MTRISVSIAIALLVIVVAALPLPAGDTALGARATLASQHDQAPSPAQAAALFYTDILEVTPPGPTVGQVVTISALIVNKGDAAGKKDIVFKLDGATKDTKKDVSLEPNKGTTLSFTFTPTEAKTYTVEIDSTKVPVTAVAATAPAPTTPATPPAPSPAPAPPAAAALTTGPLTVAPAQVKTGEKVTITATVTSGADIQSNKTIILKVNDKPVETKYVSVDAKKSVAISFTVSQTQPGSYTVDVDGQTGKFTVTGSAVPTPPPPPSSGRGPGGLDWWIWLVIGMAVGAVAVLLLQRARSPY
ncbi:MAG: CARDB domain-containing protein [Chloroflexota bacterium]